MEKIKTFLTQLNSSLEVFNEKIKNDTYTQIDQEEISMDVYFDAVEAIRKIRKIEDLDFIHLETQDLHEDFESLINSNKKIDSAFFNEHYSQLKWFSNEFYKKHKQTIYTNRKNPLESTKRLFTLYQKYLTNFKHYSVGFYKDLKKRKELEKHYFNTNIISQSIPETCLLSKLEILTNLNQSRDNLSIIHTELIKTEGVFQRINQEITQKYYKERSILNEINYQMRHFFELSSWFFSHYEYK